MKNCVKQILIITLTLTGLISCVEKKEGEMKSTLASNFISITDNEDKGIKEVLRYYEGGCKYSVGFEGKLDYFELEMTKCEYFKIFNKELNKSARNIAFLFFKNLKDERNKYDEIRVSIVLDSGSEQTFKIKIEELLTVKKQMPKVNQLVSFLKDENYSAIDKILSNRKFEEISKENFFLRIREADSHFGDISELMTSGYVIYEDGNSKVLHVEGTLLRSIQPSAFSVDIDLAAGSDEILFFNYSK